MFITENETRLPTVRLGNVRANIRHVACQLRSDIPAFVQARSQVPKQVPQGLPDQGAAKSNSALPPARHGNPEIAAAVIALLSVRSFVKKHGLRRTSGPNGSFFKADSCTAKRVMLGKTRTLFVNMLVTGNVQFYKARVCNSCRLAHDVARINTNSDLYFQRLAASLYRLPS